MRDHHDPGTAELFGAGPTRCVGYARAHAGDRDLAQQLALLRNLGCQSVFAAKVPARHRKTVACAEPLQAAQSLRTGDTLVVSRLHCLAGNLDELVEVLVAIESAGARLLAKDDGIDTRAGAGAFLRMAAAHLDACRVEWLRHAGPARSRSAQIGRPEVISTKDLRDIRKWMKRTGHNVAAAAREHGVGRSTLYRHLAANADAKAG